MNGKKEPSSHKSSVYGKKAPELLSPPCEDEMQFRGEAVHVESATNDFTDFTNIYRLPGQPVIEEEESQDL